MVAVLKTVSEYDKAIGNSVSYIMLDMLYNCRQMAKHVDKFCIYILFHLHSLPELLADLQISLLTNTGRFFLSLQFKMIVCAEFHFNFPLR